MDIVAAHQHGLIEKIEEEASALAGRPRDHGQRAVVLHHLYDHSRANHVWALGEARRELRIAKGFAALKRRLNRWGWTISRREQAGFALGRLADALGVAGRERSFAAYCTYRISATPAVRDQAEQQMPADLLAGLDLCHRARRIGEGLSPDVRDRLAADIEAVASAAVDTERLASAWAAIDATGLRRAARLLLGEKALVRAAARDAKRGWPRVEREFRDEPALPAAFRANPAQHFYALQHALAERRRQEWRDACDREPGAFELAA